MNHKKIYLRSGIVAACLLIGLELTVRLSGMVDFPIYDTDDGISYIAKPSQSGTFLNKNPWVFNDRSMGTEQNWNPVGKFNLLLIGNSIVMGGNPYKQADKLGPLIEKNLGKSITVWPIAAGGWTNVNEAIYLERHPEVVKENNFFVWEYMEGGFSQLSPDRGQYVFPSSKPIWAGWYLFRRYVLPRFFDFNMSELPPTGVVQQTNLQQFVRLIAQLSAANGKNVPGIIFLYPTKAQYLNAQRGIDYVPDRPALTRIAAEYHLEIVDVASSPDWNAGLYREGTHPTVEGNQVLAKILTSKITNAL